MTVGIDLATYTTTLTHVAPEHDLKPVRSFDAAGRLGARVFDYLQAFHGSRDIEKVGNGLPAKGFAGLSPEETAKVIASFDHEQDSKLLDEMHAADPALHLLHKIRLSAWGWSYDRIGWNETVDAYQGIRSFDLGVDCLETTLDHTTWRHKQGRSQHARMILDGVFGFLVHHRGEHVMTIGFSFASERRLLVHQVQLRNRTGNRWLFKLPGNRMELVIDRMRAAFPRHTIMVADGNSVADTILDFYRKDREGIERTVTDYRARLARTPANDDLRTYLAEAEAAAVKSDARIAHLEADRPRLAAFYGDLGRHRTRGRAFSSNGLVHRAIAA